MKYIFGLIVIGGIVCAVNMVIIHFLKMRFSSPQPVWKEEGFDTVKDEFDQELHDFRLIIEENVKNIRREQEILEQTKKELQVLVEESRQCIEKLESLKGEPRTPRPVLNLSQSAPETKEEVRDPRFIKMSFLRGQGLSAETIAHRLQMGIGEVRLRLALMEKEDAVYENR